jgi:chromosome segregation ATPase
MVGTAHNVYAVCNTVMGIRPKISPCYRQRGVAFHSDKDGRFNGGAGGGALQIETDSPSAMHEAETELRHLRRTIHALREELEQQQAGRAEAVQQAVADANGEMVQLRAIAHALRGELEAVQLSKREEVQKAVADSAGEIAELRRTVAALREQMEYLRGESEDKLQEMERASRDALNDLQSAIAVLRLELEKRHEG